jgi:prepilin signal peptidase PulO-like enzyme (type II secretory pathway)
MLTLLWLAVQDKKHLGITRRGLTMASVILLVAGCFGAVDWPSRVGGAAIGVMLLLFGVFSKEAIGMADGVVILVCGVAFGLYETVTLCFFAALYAGCCSAVLLLLKKAGKQSRIPFLPFVLLGYLTMRILVSSM